MSTPTSTRTTGLGLALVGATLFANGAWYAPLMFSQDAGTKLSEYGGEPPFQIFYVIHLAALVGLTVFVPGLHRLRGTTGRTLPGWLPVAVLIVTVLLAATVYAQAFVVPHLAVVAPAALDQSEIDRFAISMMSIWVAFLVTFVTLAVVGTIRRVVPIPAAVTIAVGAVSMPVLGPAGAMLIGAGLLYWSLTRVLRSSAQVSIASESPTGVVSRS